MFAANSINAAHDVVFGWIISSKEKNDSLNNKTYWKRAARVGCLRSLCLSTGIASTSRVTEPRA